MKNFIWPSLNQSLNEFSLKKGSTAELEKIIGQIYTGAYPVVTSSGRSAISLVLQYMKLTRENYVGIAPFSSSCIYRSVGEFCTILPGNLTNSLDGQLLYNQWGYKHTCNKSSFVIADSVDSLIVDANEIFSSGNDFEILSLAKLFGSPAGGVIFCKKEACAEELRDLVANKKHFLKSQALLGLIGRINNSASQMWHIMESYNGPLLGAYCYKLQKSFENIDYLIYDRSEKYRMVLEYLNPLVVENIVSRIPVSIPVELPQHSNIRNIQNILLKHNFSVDVRHFNLSKNQSYWDLRKVIPIPIHHQVQMTDLYSLCVDLRGEFN